MPDIQALLEKYRQLTSRPVPKDAMQTLPDRVVPSRPLTPADLQRNDLIGLFPRPPGIIENRYNPLLEPGRQQTETLLVDPPRERVLPPTRHPAEDALMRKLQLLMLERKR
jgi:hypothetical protein